MMHPIGCVSGNRDAVQVALDREAMERIDLVRGTPGVVLQSGQAKLVSSWNHPRFRPNWVMKRREWWTRLDRMWIRAGWAKR